MISTDDCCCRVLNFLKFDEQSNRRWWKDIKVLCGMRKSNSDSVFKHGRRNQGQLVNDVELPDEINTLLVALTASVPGFAGKLPFPTLGDELMMFLCRSITDVVFVDYKKGFDSVSHAKLVMKLKAYGISMKQMFHCRRYQY